MAHPVFNGQSGARQYSPDDRNTHGEILSPNNIIGIQTMVDAIMQEQYRQASLIAASLPPNAVKSAIEVLRLNFPPPPLNFPPPPMPPRSGGNPSNCMPNGDYGIASRFVMPNVNFRQCSRHVIPIRGDAQVTFGTLWQYEDESGNWIVVSPGLPLDWTSSGIPFVIPEGFEIYGIDITLDLSKRELGRFLEWRIVRGGGGAGAGTITEAGVHTYRDKTQSFPLQIVGLVNLDLQFRFTDAANDEQLTIDVDMECMAVQKFTGTEGMKAPEEVIAKRPRALPARPMPNLVSPDFSMPTI